MTSTAGLPSIAVTGATGQLGARVARRLASAGHSQRLLVRDPIRAPELPRSTVERASYEEGEAAREALAGISTVFMVSAHESIDRVDVHRAFVDAAVGAGVEHVVYTSFCGAAPDATFTLARDHWATEQLIAERGLKATFLRNNLYLDALSSFVGTDGVIRGPAGDGRVAAVARDDIADAAVAVLRDPERHAGRTYELTGREPLTLSEVATTLTAVTGRSITYERETIEEAYASRASYGAPGWQVDAWVSTYSAIADGSMERVTDAVPSLTGHAAMTLEEVLRQEASSES